MAAQDNVQIAPADGKLGVLIPGIGAVTTTFIAGVEAIKRGLAVPVGSLTQLATIRLGKRTDDRTPMIKDFVPLAGFNDLVFGGWDIYEDTAYEAAVNAQSAGTHAARTVEGAAVGDPADEGGLRSGIRPAHQRAQRKAGGTKMDKAEMLMDDIAQFRKTNDARRAGDDLVRIDRSFPPSRRCPSDARRISNAG